MRLNRDSLDKSLNIIGRTWLRKSLISHFNILIYRNKIIISFFYLIIVITISISLPQITRSGYDKLAVIGGTNSFNAELISDDLYKNAWWDIDYSTRIFKNYYKLKRRLLDGYSLAVGTDYMYLNQYASFSFSYRQGTSGIFRFYGSGNLWSNPEIKSECIFIFKIENRHKIGTGTTPRELGYETGSALSTANFKDMGWA